VRPSKAVKEVMLDFCSNLVLGPKCPSPSSGFSWFIALSKFNILGDTPHPKCLDKPTSPWLNPEFAPKSSISALINQQSSIVQQRSGFMLLMFCYQCRKWWLFQKKMWTCEWTVDDNHPANIKNLHVYPEGNKKRSNRTIPNVTLI